MNIYGLGPYGYGSSEPDEMEALQSDVMRFMAILGLCLMIIFALVQSLPQSSTDGKIPKDLTVTASVEESVQLDNETDSLKTERDLMYKTLDSLQKQLTDLDHTISKKELVNKQLVSEEKVLQQEIITGQHTLETLEKTISTVEKSIKLPTQKKQPEAKIAKRAPEPVKLPAAVDPPQKEGFTLRFQSTTALNHLLRKGNVQLLVQINENFHALQTSGAKFSFTPADSPSRFHEMEANTVPAQYKRLLAGSGIKVGHGLARIWGVVLPSSIQNEIQQSMVGNKGGELRINRYGKVSHHSTGLY